MKSQVDKISNWWNVKLIKCSVDECKVDECKVDECKVDEITCSIRCQNDEI
jgi:hypothetical protein